VTTPHAPRGDLRTARAWMRAQVRTYLSSWALLTNAIFRGAVLEAPARGGVLHDAERPT